MQPSRFGHSFFLLAVAFILVSIVAFIKYGILKGALWLGAAAACWFIGFYHDVRLFKQGKLFSERYPEKFIEKEMHRDGTNGINKVREGLFYYLLQECEVIYPKDYTYGLVAGIVNTVFSESPSNDKRKLFIESNDNVNNIKLIIDELIRPRQKLKQIITDAVWVQCILTYSMNSNLSKTDYDRLCVEAIRNLERLGLFIPGGEMPVLSEFLHNATTFFEACKADLEQQRHRLNA